MTALPWIPQNLADELVGALHNTATYITHRPDHHDQLIAAVADRLGGVEMALLETLLAATQPEETP